MSHLLNSLKEKNKLTLEQVADTISKVTYKNEKVPLHIAARTEFEHWVADLNVYLGSGQHPFKCIKEVNGVWSFNINDSGLYANIYCARIKEIKVICGEISYLSNLHQVLIKACRIELDAKERLDFLIARIFSFLKAVQNLKVQ